MLIPPETFSTAPFWDINAATLDAAQHQRFIIKRVFNNGTWNDYKALFKIYDGHAITNTLAQCKNLRPKVKNFAALIFGVEFIN